MGMFGKGRAPHALRRPQENALRAYDPTLRDKAALAVLNIFGDTYPNRQLTKNIFGSAGLGAEKLGVLDFTPAGVAFQAQEAGRDIGHGNIFAGGASLGLAAIPPARAAGGMFGRSASAGGRKLDDIIRAAEARGVSLSVEDGRNLNVSKIVVPPAARNSGIGTQIMRELSDYADQTGKTMTLTPSSHFGGSEKRLREFYRRLGFVENKGRGKDFGISEAMYRPPR